MSRASRDWKACIRQTNADRGGYFKYSYDSEGVGHFIDATEAPPIVPRKQQSLRAYRADCRHRDRECKKERKEALKEASIHHLPVKVYYFEYGPAVSSAYYMPRHLFLRRYVLK